MTFAAAFLLGSMFGACVGFIAAGAGAHLGLATMKRHLLPRETCPR